MAAHRKKDLASRRRRVEDEGDDEEGLEADFDDDSSEASVLTVEGNTHTGKIAAEPSKSEATASPQLSKVNGAAKGPVSTNDTDPADKLRNGTSDMDLMLNGLKISGETEAVEGVQYDDLRHDPDLEVKSPAVVQSSAAMDQPIEAPYERRRREHEEYKKKRDADPAFVPNRGAFFMHDHRHAGPAANGFRPFGRGRGRGRPGFGGPFAPNDIMQQQQQQHQQPADAPWAHDMHEIISQPVQRNAYYNNGRANLPPRLPVSTSKSAPPNRSLSGEKHIANVHIRVFLVNMEKPAVFSGVALKQYTRLPDHRPPLRRDKPVRISLPDLPPRYIFPAADRSFIFIPRAMRPNQQGFGGRARGRSTLGSVGGYSRRTSVFGGSIYGGSAYSPSVAQSRRSSVARDVLRESVTSPTGSTMSRPQIAIDSSKPVVKLPPQTSQSVAPQQSIPPNEASEGPPPSGVEDVPRPQTFPPPKKPNAIPMHQPRPQKAVSISDIESPAVGAFYPPPQQQQQQPFHQQVPLQVQSSNYAEAVLHSRNPSYPNHSSGTPLSQIPERAIHAQPFQPNPYQQQQNQGYYPQPHQSYPVLAPAQGYYYPQVNTMPPPFVPAQQSYHVPQQSHQQQQDPSSSSGIPGLVAQEVNGMVYYYDPTQIPNVNTYPPPPQQQVYQSGLVAPPHQMGGMMTPSPDGFYYPQEVAYYP